MRSFIMFMLATACVSWSENPTHHYNLWIDENFSTLQANDIVLTATEWQQQSSNFITFSGFASDPNGPDTIAIYAANGGTQLHSDCSGDGMIGCQWVEGVDSKIYLDATLDEGRFLQTSRHELGHALGAQHIGPGNIMCADAGCASLTIQCGDLIEVCKHWDNCDAQAMRGCQQQ